MAESFIDKHLDLVNMGKQLNTLKVLDDKFKERVHFVLLVKLFNKKLIIAEHKLQ